MHTIVRRLARAGPILALVLALWLGSNTSAQAEPIRYTAVMNGESVEPPTPSTGTAEAVVIVDPVAHTMYVYINFALMGITLQAHIHAPTDVALTGVAASATATPTLPDFPFALSFDDYEKTLDMKQESSYSPEFLAANGGTAASAETALFAAIAEGRAYIDVHTDMYPDGEVRGFLTVNNTPTENVTWGKVKALYR